MHMCLSVPVSFGVCQCMFDCAGVCVPVCPTLALYNRVNINELPPRYSETDSDTYASEEDQDYFDEDFEYEDDSPLIRKGGNNNVNNDFNNDETNNPRHGQTTPSGGVAAPAAQTDVLLVQDRCCGTCCAIAAVVTCAVLVILIVYPIVYLLKHSSIHI